MISKVLLSIQQDFSCVAHATQGFYIVPFSFAQSAHVRNIMHCLTEHTIVSGSYTASDRCPSLQGRSKTARNAAKVQPK